MNKEPKGSSKPPVCSEWLELGESTDNDRENREDSLICLLFAGVRRDLSDDVVKRSSYEGTISSAGDDGKRKIEREVTGKIYLSVCWGFARSFR